VPGTVFDGELVALSERDGRPAQNFAVVCRAVLSNDSRAAEQLRYVAFDVLSRGGVDLRGQAWQERRGHLGEVLPAAGRIRQIDCLPAEQSAHAAMVQLGFEGSVLKRRNSTYRPGRHRSWRKPKARHVAHGVLRSVRVAGDAQAWAICDVDGRSVPVLASVNANQRIGEGVELVYSRVDADGALREVRLAAAVNPVAGSAPAVKDGPSGSSEASREAASLRAGGAEARSRAVPLVSKPASQRTMAVCGVCRAGGCWTPVWM